MPIEKQTNQERRKAQKLKIMKTEFKRGQHVLLYWEIECIVVKVSDDAKKVKLTSIEAYNTTYEEAFADWFDADDVEKI